MWYFIGGAVLVILVIIFVNKAKKHSAASGGYVPNVEYLLSVGADIGLRNDENKTALEVVVDKRKRFETEDWLKHERDRLDDFDRVIESMKEAAGK